MSSDETETPETSHPAPAAERRFRVAALPLADSDGAGDLMPGVGNTLHVTRTRTRTP